MNPYQSTKLLYSRHFGFTGTCDCRPVLVSDFHTHYIRGKLLELMVKRLDLEPLRREPEPWLCHLTKELNVDKLFGLFEAHISDLK